MVGIELKGRLGNQLFRYAFMRAYICKHGIKDEIVFDLSDMRGRDSASGWENSLDYFNVAEHSCSSEKLVYGFGSPIQKYLSMKYYAVGRLTSFMGRNFQLKCQNFDRRRMEDNGLIYSLDNSSEFGYTVKNKNIFIDGSFENPKYFESIRDILLKEITPVHPLLEHNKPLMDKILNSQSVCVSVRRGDFLNGKNKSIFDVCGTEYYLKGMDEMKKRLENPVFVIFSDDVEWASDNLIRDDSEFISEKGDDPVWEKLRLMYSCKHYIISNSTFSWWAQYLCRNPEKIVISPDIWYKDDRPSYLISENFIKIPAHA